jgi:hypothetical protein
MAIVAAILVSASAQSGETSEVLFAKYREYLQKLAAEPKHFAGSVDAPPEQGEDALGWAGRED